MKFEVHGVDKETAAERIEVVEAADEREAASKAAGLGMFTSRVVAHLEPPVINQRHTAQAERKKAREAARHAAFYAKQRMKAEKAQRGEHQQWVRLTSNSEINMVFIVAIGVFVGMMAFSCCGAMVIMSGIASLFDPGTR